MAQKIISTTLMLADKQDWPISVAITDGHGELVGFVRRDNCSLHAGVLAKNKAYTAARDRQKSGSLGQWARETGKDMGYWTDSRLTGIAGGVPIIKDGMIIGAIGISGMSETQDEEVALSVINNLI